MFHKWRNLAEYHGTEFLRGVMESQEGGTWVHRALSERLAKEHQSKSIRNAFQGGRLFCRGVNLKEPTALSYGLEVQYQAGTVAPRPCRLMKEGLRVTLFGAEIHLGLQNVHELYCFKNDVRSTKYTKKNDYAKKLQPNVSCLLDKLTERDHRIDSIYPARTSGKLCEDGRYKSGHNKVNPIAGCQLNNETIIEGYRKEQYQCVIIQTPFNLDTLHKILETKAHLEKTLLIKELPLVFYEYQGGNIREIVYLSDLDICPDSLSEMKANIGKLNRFAECASYPELHQLLAVLPPSRLLDFIQRMPAEVATAIRTLSTPYKNELLTAVRQGNLADVEFFKQHGANLAAGYQCDHPDKQFPNLLELFISSDCVNHWAIDEYRTRSKELSALTQLGIMLYDEGCRARVSDRLIKALPSLAIYMLSKGESYEGYGIGLNPIELLQSCLTVGVISKEEFGVAIKCMKKSFSRNPEDLDKLLTRYLVEKLTSVTFKFDQLPDLNTLSLYGQCALAEEISAVMPVISSHGIRADFVVLKEAVNTTGNNELRTLTNRETSTTSEKAKIEAKRTSVLQFIETLTDEQASEVFQQARENNLSCVVTDNKKTEAAPASLLPGGSEHSTFGWLKDLYRKKLVTGGKSYRDLAQLAIRHYYRTPHPDQVVTMVARHKNVPNILKSEHGVDHVTRTQILAEALVELFEKHDPCLGEFLTANTDLRELIPLAMVYHDAVAEVKAKSMEEIGAAELFERDMEVSGRYPAALVQLVSSALRNKESDVTTVVVPPFTSDTSPECSEHERSIRRILRLADRIDVIRATFVIKNWKEPQPVSSLYAFDSRLLDIPDAMRASQDFKTEFDDLMEGAKDLAYVTGGEPRGDNSCSGSYEQKY